MHFIGFCVSILSLIGWAISLIPGLIWLNWACLPLALLGLVFCIIGIIISFHGRSIGIAGIAVSLIVIALGAVKLLTYYKII